MKDLITKRGVECEDCHNYFKQLIALFINKIGFKMLCDKCKRKSEALNNKGLSKILTKKEFCRLSNGV